MSQMNIRLSAEVKRLDESLDYYIIRLLRNHFQLITTLFGGWYAVTFLPSTISLSAPVPRERACHYFSNSFIWNALIDVVNTLARCIEYTHARRRVIVVPAYFCIFLIEILATRVQKVTNIPTLAYVVLTQ